MNNSDLIIKINKLIKFYKEKRLNLKLWNMNTDPINICKRFSKNISENLNENEVIIEIELRKNNYFYEDKEKYDLYINNIKVTPSSNNKSVSWSAIRQYIDVFNALNIVFLNAKLKNNLLIQKVSCNANLKKTLLKFFSNDPIILSTIISNLIIKSFNNKINRINNLGYSFFISILFFINLNELDDDSWIQPLKVKNKDFLTIKDLQVENTCKETYKSVKKLSDQFDFIINKIYRALELLNFENQNEKSFSNTKDLVIEMMDKKSNNYRNKFKQSLIKRSETLYINQRYVSDVFNSDTNDKAGLIAIANELEGCHIYSVENIKNKILEVFNDLWNDNKFIEPSEVFKNDKIMELFDHIKNPSNGILMKSHYHQYYDLNYFSFNLDGEMIYDYKDEKYLFNILEFKKIKINNEILNSHLKYFLTLSTI